VIDGLVKEVLDLDTEYSSTGLYLGLENGNKAIGWRGYQVRLAVSIAGHLLHNWNNVELYVVLRICVLPNIELANSTLSNLWHGWIVLMDLRIACYE
jgi:hypothetical protein